MRTLKGYIRYMRKQPKHMQHMHAIVFAGSITALIAVIILYTDYGFWHEKYQRSDDLVISETVTNPKVESESLGEMLSRFWDEAHTQFGSIGTKGSSLLEGKETYTR